MAYNANIPQATDLLSTSQGQILGNFTQLNTAWLINHVDFNAGDAGKHKWVTFPSQGTAPAATPPTGSGFLGSELGLYNAISNITAINELYVNRQSFAGVKQTALTSSILSTSTPGQNSDGWTYLPSGLLLKWGFGSPVGTGAVFIDFPTSASTPVFNQIFCAIVSTYSGVGTDTNTFVRLRSLSTTQLGVYCSQRTTLTASTGLFTYLAIGY